MNKLDIKVEYIYHSGFSIETKNHFLVFDYYKGDLNIPDKNTTFFVTHGHADHYNKKIFDYKNRAKYVISDDIEDVKESNNIKLVHPGDEIKFNGMDIKVLGSTDEGSSFMVKLDGYTFFHAGDLNWWAWEDSTKEKELERERDYKFEVDKLLGEEIDLAFVPVDPRLKHNYHLAGEYFIKSLKPKYFFPMHFGDNSEYNKDFIEKMKDYPSKIFNLEGKNKKFEL